MTTTHKLSAAQMKMMETVLECGKSSAPMHLGRAAVVAWHTTAMELCRMQLVRYVHAPKVHFVELIGCKRTKE